MNVDKFSSLELNHGGFIEVLFWARCITLLYVMFQFRTCPLEKEPLVRLNPFRAFSSWWAESQPAGLKTGIKYLKMLPCVERSSTTSPLSRVAPSFTWFRVHTYITLQILISLKKCVLPNVLKQFLDHTQCRWQNCLNQIGCHLAYRARCLKNESKTNQTRIN